MIWIYRRDLLGQSISRCVAEQAGQWISGATRRGTSVYNYEAIVRNAKLIRNQNLKWQAFFANVPDRSLLAVVYEDLLSDQSKQLATVNRFLDPDLNVSPQTPEKTRKQSGQTSIDWTKRFAAEVSDLHKWILEPQKF